MLVCREGSSPVRCSHDGDVVPLSPYRLSSAAPTAAAAAAAANPMLQAKRSARTEDDRLVSCFRLILEHTIQSNVPLFPHFRRRRSPV